MVAGRVGLETKIPELGLYFGRVHLLLVQLIPVFHYYFVAPLVLGRISPSNPLSFSNALGSRDGAGQRTGNWGTWVFATNSFVGARNEEDGSEILQGKKIPFLVHTN